jgi:hypothetical protein
MKDTAVKVFSLDRHLTGEDANDKSTRYAEAGTSIGKADFAGASRGTADV